MFKVLVIAYYFPPLGLSGVQRTLKFTKYFKKYNWQPTVITTGKLRYFAHDEYLMKEAIDSGTTIIRTESINPNKKITVRMPSSFIMKFFGRVSKTLFIPDNKIFWSKRATRKAKKLLKKENFDAIFITGPPFSSMVSIVKLKEKFDIPIFIDYRDSWINNQFRFYPTPYHKYKHKKLEDSVLRKVDRITVVNRQIKENLLKTYKFLKFNDIDIIPHGYDPDDFDKVIPLPKENKKLIITHSGIFYEEITPKYLLKALKQLSKEKPQIAANIELRFIGHFKRENQKLVKRLKLESFVKELGYLNHLESVRQIISSDILWLMLPNTEKMKNVSPGKLFEYFGTKKPILASLPDGTAKNNIIEYGAVFLTSPNDITEIKNALIEIHNLYISDNLPTPNIEFVEKHNRIKLTEQLVKIFQFYLRAE